MADTGVLIWWGMLSAISVFNMASWIVLWARHRKEAIGSDAAIRRTLLLLSMLFVFGCAYRSFLPRAEAQRITFVDVWFASAALARTVATVAELAFVAQVTILLREYGRSLESRRAVTLSHLLVPMIAVAEVFSWYTAVTSNFIGSIFEESLWAITFTLVAIAAIDVERRSDGRLRQTLRAGIVAAIGYVTFMCTVDVPMYLRRYRGADSSTYRTVWDGLIDAQTRRVVTMAWQDWREEMPWMSLYFSFCVWLSLAMTQVTLPKTRR